MWWQVLGMPMDAEGEEVIFSGADSGMVSPYMHYAQEDEVRDTTTATHTAFITRTVPEYAPFSKLTHEQQTVHLRPMHFCESIKTGPKK